MVYVLLFGVPTIAFLLAVVFLVLFFCFLFIWKNKKVAKVFLVLSIIFSVIFVVMLVAIVALVALLMMAVAHM